MQFKKLGRTDLKVSTLGYGAWGIGGRQWLGGTDDESLQSIRRSFQLGLNFIDTALAYGDGHSEQLLSTLIHSAPHEILMATKIPPKNRIWPATKNFNEVYPYDYCIAATEESLRNLKLETIHLQQFHVWDPSFVEHDEWKRVVEDLKKSGKVQYFGISATEHEPDTVLTALETGLIDAVQVIYNIFDQSPTQHLFPLCEKMNIGVLARVPLDEGGLTGTINEQSQFEAGEFRAHYFRDDRTMQIRQRVEQLQADLAKFPELNSTLPEIALRFCLSHPAVSTVIPGMRRVKNVESNAKAADAGALPNNVCQMLKKHEWLRNFYQ
jgi:aryl-alcohol dehydrogenase-like predicted oxidoreductase